tara:strand:+ start:1588 stop:1923 length:336 start_codon:yes stop_codon:yes gene_type:complete
MEIAEAINNVISQLHSKEADLTSKISTDSAERIRLQNIVSHLQEQLDKLDSIIINSKAELDSLKKTIHETEDGYKNITEAGKTLMAIVTQNLPKIQKIHTQAEITTEISSE